MPSFIDNPINYLSQGLVPIDVDQSNSIISSGMPVIPTENIENKSLLLPISTSDMVSFTPQEQDYLQTSDIDGPIKLDYLSDLLLDDTSIIGQINPTINPSSSSLSPAQGENWVSYSGSELKAIIELQSDPNGVNGEITRISKQLVELTTITVSIYRSKIGVRSLGFIGHKGFGRAGRTIAGTMILTKFTADILMRFLQQGTISDASADSFYSKIDQLPPFNITLLFSNEKGYISYQRILGIEFLTDGSVYSVNDSYSEQTISFYASDFTPLLPVGVDNKYKSNNNQPFSKQERTVSSVWTNNNQVNSMSTNIDLTSPILDSLI